TQPLAALEIGLDGGELKLLCVLVHVENPKSWMGVQLFGGSSACLAARPGVYTIFYPILNWPSS
ncbi:hypothetical protein, partial [Pseudomonas lundensis]|uniref:hypothetical protein n=1 Tax=Pseudomonas lundensis TaxID=86185 RepID=UPI001CA45262